MPASELQRKTVLFAIFFGIVLFILVAFPFLASGFKEYLLPQFSLWIQGDGRLTNIDGGEPTMVAATAFSLIVNIARILKVFLWMALVIAVVRFFSYLILTTVFRHSQQSEIASLLKTVLSIVIYLVSFFIIFQSQYPDVQLTPLFTGSAIIGIVFGLALQDTLGNLFAGIALQADQPFQVGDVITVTNRNSGVVESVSWRGVKIRTFQNKLLVMSNAVMGKETIEVAPRENLNARLVQFTTVFANSPSKTIQVVREAVRNVENVSQKIRPVVRIRDLGPNGIDWEVKYWADDYTKHNDTDAQIRQRIWYVFSRENIEFAHPVRTLYTEEKPQQTPLEEYVETASEFLHRVAIFAPLSNSEIEKLAEASEDRIFTADEAIVNSGQQGTSMFVIVRGSVKVQIPAGNSLRTINELKTNDYFGEMSLLTGKPRSATVIALEETEVIQIHKEAMQPIFDNNPDLVKAICKLVDNRQELLESEMSVDIPAAENGSGIVTSIKKFFGLK